MSRQHIAVAMFAALILIALYLFFRILRPFFAPLIWGAVLAGVFFPLNTKLHRRLKRNNLRAFIMCAIVVAVIIVPAVFLAIGLVSEITEVYPKFKAATETGKYDFVFRPQTYGWNEKIKGILGRYGDTSNLDVESFILNNLDRLTKFLLKQVSSFLANFSMAIVTFVFAVISMFYFFRDGDRLVKRVRELLPMSEDLKSNLTGRIKEVVHATVYGGVLVAGIQGIAGGLIFWIMGIPSPILWGGAMAILALVPLLGPYLIYIPAAAVLIVSGSWVRGIILLALGIVLVSQADNILKPIIIGRRTKIHQLLLFFSMLGGLKAFGLLGIILGPVLASIILALLEVYKPHAKSEA
ncbi:MAG: AI-2E family transporter [Candidatus Eisenbacteria bacterium]